MLKESFYTRDSITVAKELLGKKIVFNGKEAMIVETEAYTTNDPGSHAYHKKTPRNSVMFEKGGVLYIYFCYGMFNMLNIVTDKKDVPSAVLIRAIEPLNFSAKTSGPGLVTKALGITREQNNIAIGKEFYLEHYKKPKEIVQTTRIGLKEGAELPYRFYIKNNPYISKK